MRQSFAKKGFARAPRRLVPLEASVLRNGLSLWPGFGRKEGKSGKAPRFKGQDGCVGWSVDRLAKKTWRPSSRIGKRRWPLRESCIASGIISLSRKPLGVLGVCPSSDYPIVISNPYPLSENRQNDFNENWNGHCTDRNGRYSDRPFGEAEHFVKLLVHAVNLGG